MIESRDKRGHREGPDKSGQTWVEIQGLVYDNPTKREKNLWVPKSEGSGTLIPPRY